MSAQISCAWLVVLATREPPRGVDDATRGAFRTRRWYSPIRYLFESASTWIAVGHQIVSANRGSDDRKTARPPTKSTSATRDAQRRPDPQRARRRRAPPSATR